MFQQQKQPAKSSYTQNTISIDTGLVKRTSIIRTSFLNSNDRLHWTLTDISWITALRAVIHNHRSEQACSFLFMAAELLYLCGPITSPDGTLHSDIADAGATCNVHMLRQTGGSPANGAWLLCPQGRLHSTVWVTYVVRCFRGRCVCVGMRKVSTMSLLTGHAVSTRTSTITHPHLTAHGDLHGDRSQLQLWLQLSYDSSFTQYRRN